jgi:hypothetical protein
VAGNKNSSSGRINLDVAVEEPEPLDRKKIIPIHKKSGA